MNGPFAALLLQPDEEPVVIPPNPLSDGDHIIFAAFVVLITAVLGFDMFRTWWRTNEWRREARRRRRAIR
jgi:hypothetical protein